MTTNLSRGITVVLGAVCISAVAAGCTPMIDGSKVEGAIKDTAGKNGITLATVTCPKDQKVAQGGTFQCQSTTSDGDAVVWDVTQTSANGDVDFKSTSVMDQQKLGDQVEPQLKSQVGDIDMKCPSKWVVAKAGAKFSCDATVKGEAATMDCAFSDNSKYDCKLHGT